MEFPHDSAEVGVGDGKTQEGQDVGDQKEDNLVQRIINIAHWGQVYGLC